MSIKAALVFVFAFGTSSASAFVGAPRPTNKRTTTFLSAEIAPDAEMFSEEHGDAPVLPPIPPTSKRLFLVRHGEVINPGGNRPVYYGALDVPLSPLGEAEAQAAAEARRGRAVAVHGPPHSTPHRIVCGCHQRDDGAGHGSQ